MSMIQTILSLGAMMFLSTVLVTFYTTLGSTGGEISGGQDGILGTSIATSYLETAQGEAFDAYTDTMKIDTPTGLTEWNALGPETAFEDTITRFDDFDDYNGYTIEKEASNTGRKYTTTFSVYYVDPNNVKNKINSRSFVKRMDLKTWRSFPLSGPGTAVDTVRMSLVLGYFHFD